MTCSEFNEQLPDYVDDTIDAAGRAEAERHLAGCRECQLALRHSRALGGALQAALERETAHLRLARRTQEAVLSAAARANAGSERSAGRWRFWLPLGALAATAAVAAILLAAGRWPRARAEHRTARSTWAIDVPFQDGQQVGVIHAEFSAEETPAK